MFFGGNNLSVSCIISLLFQPWEPQHCFNDFSYTVVASDSWGEALFILVIVVCFFLFSSATFCCRLHRFVVVCNILLSSAAFCCRLQHFAVVCSVLLSTVYILSVQYFLKNNDESWYHVQRCI